MDNRLEKNNSPAWRWGIIVLAALFCIIVLLLLAPKYFRHWDEIQLRLAINSFDLKVGHPHPPGYYLYVVLSSLASFIAPEWIEPGRIISALAVGIIVGMICACFPRKFTLGHLALWTLAFAIAALTSPLIYFYSLAHLAYAAEACLWLAILLWLTRRPQGKELLAWAVFAGVAGGMRQTLAIWAIVVFCVETVIVKDFIRLKKIPSVFLAMLFGVLLWAIPMLITVGGIHDYLEASKSIVLKNIWDKSVFVGGLPVLKERFFLMLGSTVRGLGAGIVMPFIALVLRFYYRDTVKRYDSLLLGSIISFLFYLLIIYDSEGYLISFVIVLLAYGILCIAANMNKCAPRWSLIVPIIIILVRIMEVAITPATTESAKYFQEYKNHDIFLQQVFTTVRQNFSPNNTILVTSKEYWAYSFRHVMYYLPEYTTMQLSPDFFIAITTKQKPYLTAKDHKVWTEGPYFFDISKINASKSNMLIQNVIYMIPWDAENFIHVSCNKQTRAIPINGQQFIYLIQPTANSTVALCNGVLCCPSHEEMNSLSQ
ncbi:MAG: hypothetical protein A2Y62_03580 [Candidatus Fischerbacteria bacterium RBG_13_37_8]|uniref:Glycosyltransferase RgtA/B/C/D-like domain-containing protein n=1 Tax=Candidatus Fischerbacteria bacterium RBG_13_37_8 TaxID=1817863 RepID=A0A1F5V842_9BACT|nr:MAG: hypothetical protein A2Y62_03580 [Candidatus Fischerbacteria bacterium RBG_13_37_8]